MAGVKRARNLITPGGLWTGDRAIDAARMLRLRDASQHLIPFCEVTTPDPADPLNPLRTGYDARPFHRSVANAVERVIAGVITRLLLNMPPRHGKTELSTRRGVAWAIGRNPRLNIIVGTYNQDFANDHGRAVRTIMQMPQYEAIFPGVRLQRGSEAADRLMTTAGGMIAFVGRGGSITGRGADLLLCDDPLKNSEEAENDTIRNNMWRWWVRDMMTRMSSDRASVLLIQTRWHEDDIPGRITDPKNPEYSAREAKNWKLVDIPAIAVENDPLKRQPGAPLWPEKFGTEYLEDQKARDPTGFSALYQGRPGPEQGILFKRDRLITYEPRELPAKLRYYAASDHALGQKTRNDPTCLLTVGVCEDNIIWVMPDIFWDRAPSDVVVEEMINLAAKYGPIIWWAETDHIARSIGPFLNKRMRERHEFINMSLVTGHSGDKVKKAQSTLARVNQKGFRFPAAAPWWINAKAELLGFPAARHDDLVDALALIGRGLHRMVGAAKTRELPQGPAVGTLAWVKGASAAQRVQRGRIANMRGL